MTHAAHLQRWADREQFQVDPFNGPMHRGAAYGQYLKYLQRNSRVYLVISEDMGPIEEEYDSAGEDEVHPYDRATREGTQPQRAPFQHYMVSVLLYDMFNLHVRTTK